MSTLPSSTPEVPAPREARDLLLSAARAVSLKAYAPYSRFRVGAALLGSDGKLYTGCNVENASYSLTLCAERNALFHAIAAGCRTFRALAIVAQRPVPPCGACLQALAEFCPPQIPIFLDAFDAERSTPVETTLGALFPNPFGSADLSKGGTP